MEYSRAVLQDMCSSHRIITRSSAQYMAISSSWHDENVSFHKNSIRKNINFIVFPNMKNCQDAFPEPYKKCLQGVPTFFSELSKYITK